MSSSIIFVESAFSSASEIAELPVPEFTVTFEDKSYYVQSTYGIDQYTGDSVLKRAGYYEEDKSIIIKIENIQVDSFNTTTVNGTDYYLRYSVRAKGKYGEDWDYGIVSPDGRPRIALSALSDSNYTVYSISANNYPSDAQIEFQVSATISHNEPYWEAYDLSYLKECGVWFGPTGEYKDNWIMDAKSEWSETQTLNLSALESPTTTDQQDQTNQINQSNLILAGALIIIPIATGIGLLIYLSKRN